MARSITPTNPTISVFAWDDDDEVTVTDYTAMAHTSPCLSQEDLSSANSQEAVQSSQSGPDSRCTSPEATQNPKTRTRKSLPDKLPSMDIRQRSTNTFSKTSDFNVNSARGAEIFPGQYEKGQNFDRNTIAAASFRSNSCPTYDAANRLKAKSATLKTSQSDNVCTKSKSSRRCSDVSLISWMGIFNKPTIPDKDVSVSGSLEHCEQLAQPSIPPESIQNFLTDQHTINQKMRQGDLYEIIQTERNHCIAVAELRRLFQEKNYRAILGTETKILNHIEKIYSIHYDFHGGLRKMQGNGVYIEEVGSAINQFTTCVKLLKLDQSYGLVSYYCSRAVKELPSRTPVQITGVPLRLTKFQIQLDSLLKHSVDESDRERKSIAKALNTVKEILRSINEIIDTKEKDDLLKTLHRKIDPKSVLYLDGIKFTKQDLLDNRRLVHHDSVKINVTQQKVHSVELLLFDDVLVFLQGTSSSKYQFYSTHADKNLIHLHFWILREKAGTKTSIYLFSSNPYSSMLEVMTSSGSARTLLIKHLSASIKSAKDKHQKMLQEKRRELQNIVELSYDAFKQQAEGCIEDIAAASSRSDKSVFRESFHKATQLQLVSLRRVIHSGDELLNEFESNSRTSEEGANESKESITSSVQKHLEDTKKFLELTLKLTEVSSKFEPQTKLGENIDIDQKMEDLRVQHSMFVDEKQQTEERLQEEKTALEEKSKSLELLKQKLERKENDLVSREQEQMLRRKLMDKYLGACISRNNKLVVDRPLTVDSLFDLIERYESTQKELTALKSKHSVNSPEGVSQSSGQWNQMIAMHSMPDLSAPERVQNAEANENDSSTQDVSDKDHSQSGPMAVQTSTPNVARGEHQNDFERPFPDTAPRATRKTLKQRLASAVRSTLRSKKPIVRSCENIIETKGSDSPQYLINTPVTSRYQLPAATGRRAERAQVKQTLPKKLAS